MSRTARACLLICVVSGLLVAINTQAQPSREQLAARCALLGSIADRY
ncbi:MAG: hypothetical protein ACHQK9_20515 [Reyranellales bacterium]